MNRPHNRSKRTDRDRDPVFTKRVLEQLGPEFLETAADLNTMSIRVDQLAAELWDSDDTRFTWFDSVARSSLGAHQLSDIKTGLEEMVGAWKWILEDEEAG